MPSVGCAWRPRRGWNPVGREFHCASCRISAKKPLAGSARPIGLGVPMRPSWLGRMVTFSEDSTRFSPSSPDFRLADVWPFLPVGPRFDRWPEDSTAWLLHTATGSLEPLKLRITDRALSRKPSYPRGGNSSPTVRRSCFPDCGGWPSSAECCAGAVRRTMAISIEGSQWSGDHSHSDSTASSSAVC